MGSCISRQEVRCRERTPSIDNIEPVNQEEAMQQRTVQYYRPRVIYLNQHRVRLPIETSAVTFRTINRVNTVNTNELIERLTTFTQMLNELDTTSIASNPTYINQYKTYILNETTTKTCAICLASMGDTLLGEMVTELPCEHLFHKTCLARWFKDNNTCPLCKLIC